MGPYYQLKTACLIFVSEVHPRCLHHIGKRYCGFSNSTYLSAHHLCNVFILIIWTYMIVILNFQKIEYQNLRSLKLCNTSKKILVKKKIHRIQTRSFLFESLLHIFSYIFWCQNLKVKTSAIYFRYSELVNVFMCYIQQLHVQSSLSLIW